MKRNSKRICYLLIAIAIFLAAGYVYDSFREAQKKQQLWEQATKQNSRLQAVRNLSAFPASVNTALIRHMVSEGKTESHHFLSELKRFNFDHRSETSRESIYALNGLTPTMYKDPFGANPASERLFVFNLRNRVGGLKSEQPDLLAILPDISDSVCRGLLKYLHTKKVEPRDNELVEIPALNMPPILEPHLGTSAKLDSSGVATLPFLATAHQDQERPMGCAEHNGKNYFFIALKAF